MSKTIDKLITRCFKAENANIILRAENARLKEEVRNLDSTLATMVEKATKIINKT